MEIVKVDTDGSVTIRFTKTEALVIRDHANSGNSASTRTLTRHLAMVHGEPAAHTGPGRPPSELPDWAIGQLSDRAIDPSEVTHFIAGRDGRTLAAAVDGKPVVLTRP